MARWNAFRNPLTGKLDREYLRVCAVYRLFVRQRRVDKERAIELLSSHRVKNARALVEFWVTGYAYQHPENPYPWREVA